MSTQLQSPVWPLRKALTVLVTALVLAVIITAVLSAWIVDALHALGATGATLDKVTIRTLELVAIALTAVALNRFGGGGKAAWGIPDSCALARRLSLGLLLGVGSLGVVCVLLYLLEVRVVRHDLSMELGYWLGVLASSLLSAIAVGLLEELWFRGGLFTLLCRGGGVGAALIGGSAFYAAAHFLDIPGGLDGSGSQQWTGLQVLEAAVQNVFRLQHLDSFVALFLAGLTLALVRLRQGDVAVCIGIHAGWVLTIKVFKKTTYLSPDGTNRFLVGQYDDLVGWVATACFALMLVLVWRFMRPHQRT